MSTVLLLIALIATYLAVGFVTFIEYAWSGRYRPAWWQLALAWPFFLTRKLFK